MSGRNRLQVPQKDAKPRLRYVTSAQGPCAEPCHRVTLSRPGLVSKVPYQQQLRKSPSSYLCQQQCLLAGRADANGRISPYADR